MTLSAGDPRHGTRNAYTRHLCRCDPCRAANTNAATERRQTIPPLGRLRVYSDDPYTSTSTRRIIDRPDWMADGACRGINPNLFFPERGAPVAAAQRICDSCPVRTPCAEYALDQHITHGIWGGLTGRQRIRITKTRRAA